MDLPAHLARLPVRALPGDLTLLQATAPRARLRGLGGVRALPPSVALHLPGCRSVHTLAMRFALDLIWLDDRGRVLHVDRGVPPRRVRGCRRARSVVETRAGEAARFVVAVSA